MLMIPSNPGNHCSICVTMGFMSKYNFNTKVTRSTKNTMRIKKVSSLPCNFYKKHNALYIKILKEVNIT